MSDGFPIIPDLLALGPRTFKDDGQVLDPEKYVTSAQLNLWKWQLAGCGITTPLAWVVVNSDGTFAAAGAVWNPEGSALLHPTTATTGTGVYTVTWAAEYPDQLGTNRSITLYAGKPFVQSTTANLVAVANIVGTVCTVKITAGASGAATDAKFLLEVR